MIATFLPLVVFPALVLVTLTLLSTVGARRRLSTKAILALAPLVIVVLVFLLRWSQLPDEPDFSNSTEGFNLVFVAAINAALGMLLVLAWFAVTACVWWWRRRPNRD